jgi:hypothetical protein
MFLLLVKTREGLLLCLKTDIGGDCKVAIIYGKYWRKPAIPMPCPPGLGHCTFPSGIHLVSFCKKAEKSTRDGALYRVLQVYKHLLIERTIQVDLVPQCGTINHPYHIIDSLTVLINDIYLPYNLNYNKLAEWYTSGALLNGGSGFKSQVKHKKRKLNPEKLYKRVISSKYIPVYLGRNTFKLRSKCVSDGVNHITGKKVNAWVGSPFSMTNGKSNTGGYAILRVAIKASLNLENPKRGAC